MKRFIILAYFAILFSCKKESKEFVEYDKEGNLLSKGYVSNGKSLDSMIYFKNNKVDAKFFFKKNSDKECYIKYYDNEGVISEGNTINKIKTGKWKFYGSKPNEMKVVEFKNICGEEYANQEWNYNAKGKLKIDLCTYYTNSFKNKIFKVGSTNFLTIKYIPMIKKGTICRINFSNEIDSTFCNLDKIKKESFRSTDSLTFTIPMMFDTKGTFFFRGFIDEHFFGEPNKEGYSNHKTRRVYVDIPFEVK
jgi:hypothetical protein